VIRARPPGGGTGLAVVVAVASVALGAAPRLLFAAGPLSEAARPFVWSDVVATYVERLGGTALPYFDAFFEYPPVVGYLSGAFVRITRDPVAYVIAWAVVSAIAAAAVALILAREAGSDRALLWSLSPQLLLYGAINFDVLAVLFLVAAVALARAGRSYSALAALALGTLTKAFPALPVPSELARLWRERGPRAAAVGLGTFLVTAIAIALPSLLAPHPFTESAAYTAGLANFDSAWGLVHAALRGLGFGAADAVVVVLSAAGAIAMYTWSLRRAAGADLARSAALVTVAVLLWTRLYSPQYSLWLVPFFALGALPRRAFALLSAADIVIFATVYPLTLVARPSGTVEATALFAVLAVGVVLRHVALVMAWALPPGGMLSRDGDPGGRTARPRPARG
jgi:uncharacterized membrane protein